MVAKRAAADQLDPAFMSEIDFPIVKRGFDPASVQAFAAAVGVEMSRLLEENRGLQAQVTAARSRANSEPLAEVVAAPVVAPVVQVPEPVVVAPVVVAPVAAPVALAPSVLEMWGTETTRLLETARENVAHVMAQAEAEARGIVAKAELEAEKIRASAVQDGERQTQSMRDQSASDLARAAIEREQITDATRRSRLELAQLEQDKRVIGTNLLSVKEAVAHALSAIDATAAETALLQNTRQTYASAAAPIVTPVVSESTVSAYDEDVLVMPDVVPVPAPVPAPPAVTAPERFVPPTSHQQPPTIGKLS
jgi:cell division septum initiation protein DivIVA